MAQKLIDLEIKQRIIVDLMAGMRIKEINQKYGLSHSVISKWRNNDLEFQKVYRETTDALRQASFDKLKELAHKAAETMEELLDCDDNKLRFEVAKQILGYQTSWEPLESTTLNSPEVTAEKFAEIFGNV